MILFLLPDSTWRPRGGTSEPTSLLTVTAFSRNTPVLSRGAAFSQTHSKGTPILRLHCKGITLIVSVTIMMIVSVGFFSTSSSSSSSSTIMKIVSVGVSSLCLFVVCRFVVWSREKARARQSQRASARARAQTHTPTAGRCP